VVGLNLVSLNIVGGKGSKNISINHFEKARNDRNWRKMAEYEIDRVRNPEKYEG